MAGRGARGSVLSMPDIEDKTEETRRTFVRAGVVPWPPRAAGGASARAPWRLWP